MMLRPGVTIGILALAGTAVMLALPTSIGTSPALAQTKIAVPDAPGVDAVVFAVPAGSSVEAALPQVIAQMGASLGGVGPRSTPTQVTIQGQPVRLETLSFNKAPGKAFFFLSTPAAPSVCVAVIPLTQVKQVARQVGNACMAAMSGGAKSAGSAAGMAGSAGTTPVVAAGPPAHADNWSKVEGVYFRQFSTFGVGGLMITDFEPIVLFKDGTFYEIEDAALEDVDLAASHAAKPRSWGRWQRSGDGFTLVDDTSKTGTAKPMRLQDGQFYKAFAAEAEGSRLTKRYRRISGGGNTALGGTSMVAASTDLAFRADGSFGRDSGGGGSDIGSGNGNVAVATRNSGVGRYQIKNYTITMTQKDGSVRRQFFAFGSQGKTPAVDSDMLFIGGRVFSIVR